MDNWPRERLVLPRRRYRVIVKSELADKVVYTNLVMAAEEARKQSQDKLVIDDRMMSSEAATTRKLELVTKECI
jgi:hypothetical protein